MQKTMDVGHIMTNFPPIIENIFKHLSWRELDSCAQVCDLWKRIAETEKSRRGDIAIFFQAARLYEFHSDFLQKLSIDSTDDMETNLSKQLKEMKIKPNYCLTFATNSLLEDFEDLFPNFHFPSSSQRKFGEPKRFKHEDKIRKKAYLKAVISTALGQYLPEKCQTTFSINSGIIGCLSTGSHFTSLEIEEGCAISGIVIPSVPGLHIFRLPLDGKETDIAKMVPTDLTVKCLLMFITPYESTYQKIIQSALLRESSQIALGGALIERSDSGCGSCLAFCGDSVEAASIIIKPKDRESQIEAKLKLFKETGLLKDRCFAFMFPCVARGVYAYKRHNVESSIFSSLYPDVPLLGIFGNGELGIDYLPNIPNNHEVLRIGKLVRPRKKFLHSYTTIFVLISLKL